jgi:hypothetical protein
VVGCQSRTPQIEAVSAEQSRSKTYLLNDQAKTFELQELGPEAWMRLDGPCVGRPYAQL